MDWLDVTQDPVSPTTHDFLVGEMRRSKRITTGPYPDFLRVRLAGRSVMDIGVVEHDPARIGGPDWMHDLVRDAASTTLGIDIVEAGIEVLEARGYRVALVDATSDRDLGERFDVVHVGDVLEHVANPVAMLEFAGRHLAPCGEILVRTPNPWWFSHILRNVREGVLIANAEHVSWITPTLALEIGRRAGLRLDEYWLVTGSVRSAGRRLVHAVLRGSELLAPHYLYVFSSPAATGP